jgi:hypothetical protein
MMTVPGVGPVVALTYRATVDVPARFRNSKAVGAAFGLTPSQYQSGEINRTGAISKCGDEMMRVMLYEAAQIMLVRGEVVLAQSLGHEDRQAPRDEEGDRGAGAPVGGDHAPHLGGRHRVPRATSTPRVAESLKVLDSKRPIREADI